ncbi:alpha/beta fold hydrolase [Amycolatopsis sp. Hca4]|uniref:thioesterase II family protein n=1 Tax=unclassified Amycolatopsis TaxID=2618356 RepID=UPI000D5A3203|nr:alpha/beta fold hydrolase [Amycolatopsis sp. Hca4]AWH12637.1 RmpR [Amycolatopsis sp.]QKV76523.1 thioesterase [Amycolatopsis sp. Hca4]
MLRPDAEKWLRRFERAPDARARLVCLPHAGGSASFFFPLAKALAPAVEVLAVQYPGRQDRRHEPPVDSIGGLVDRLLEVLRPLDDRPLALFGHSMGAIIGYELALRLPEAGRPAPAHLFASGRRAPSRYRDDDIRGASDDRLVAELRKLGGSDAAMLADPELLAMVLPAIRSDYRAVDTYRHEPGRRVACPVTAFTGDRDPRVSVEEARAWAEHTTGPSELRVLPGGHFFLVDQAAPIIATITEKLAGAVLSGRTS